MTPPFGFFLFARSEGRKVVIKLSRVRIFIFWGEASSMYKMALPSNPTMMLKQLVSFILFSYVSAFGIVDLKSLNIRRTTTIPAINSLCKSTRSHILHPNLEESVLDRNIQEDALTESWQQEEEDIWIKQAFEVGHESMLLPENIHQTNHVNMDNAGDSRPFPLKMIVNQRAIKKALLISAVNQRIGGVIISGRRGTGKSVLARAVHRLLPPDILRVKGSCYNIDPSGSAMVDSFLEHDLITRGISLSELDTEKVQTPFVQIPLNVMEDSLLGTVDIEKSMETGRTIFSPGLLATAHRGVLYVDEINLLDEETVNILLNVIGDGFVKVEREGLSVTYPCKPLLVATYNPEEGEIREHLLDRIGVALSTDAHLFSVDERVKVVENVAGFSAGTKEQFSADAAEELKQADKEEVEIQGSIAAARSILSKVEIDNSQILYICEEATRAGCEGQRAEIFATEIAKANAALDGRMKVNANDLQTGVVLAMASRGSFLPTEASEDEDTPSPSSSQSGPSLEPLSPPPDLDTREKEKSEQEQQDEKEEDLEPESETEEDTAQEEDLEMEIPLEFMFGVDMMPIDPKLMYFNKWARKGKGGKRAKIFNLNRGRYVKPIFPKGKQGKIAVAATLRAAAPYQIPRRKRAIGTRKEGRIVIVDKDDFRIKRMSRKAGSLIIFVVDASGSMALNRMDAAKGAAMSLLSEAYKSRDKICLVEFHGEKAQVLVPPTKSMALTKNRLVSMPCGGGSPLAHGLMLAMRTGLNAIKVKQDVGRVIIVLLTDGRANIPVCTSMGESFDPIVDTESKDDLPSRNYLKDEVLACAKQLGSLPDFSLLCIDTEDQFVGTGLARDIAKAASGNYYHIIDTDASSVSLITKQGLESDKMMDYH